MAPTTLPDTQCAQILKAKYYPNDFFMDTVFVRNGSSTWHAIGYGLEILKQGVTWHGGSGSKIETKTM
jgi:hypothetical protein